MSKCKKCGAMNESGFENFICMSCDFVNGGEIEGVKIKDDQSLLGAMGDF